MEDLEGKVAVVTGAAGGIGKAMAERFGREGMKVVLADIDETALVAAVEELRRQELEVSGVVTDVSSADSVAALAEQTLARYGKVHLVCNNAGVFLAQKPVWESTLKDWEWILGVNLWGVIHGIRSFVPVMLDQDEEGWIVNTASMGGLISGNSIYGMTKHAVVALSETLYFQLKARNANVGVSVLCPLFVDTRIMESERNRPPDLWNPDGPGSNPLAATWIGREGNISPAEQAEMVLEDLRAGRFYMFPHMQAIDDNVRARFENILGRTNPEPRPIR
jgi:NAD(P)-dependent dehydrogenase (short-subunit alcohol dehydrogenase family)